MADDAGQSELIAEFTGVTGSNAERARFFLESSGWQLHVSFILLVLSATILFQWDKIEYLFMLFSRVSVNFFNFVSLK